MAKTKTKGGSKPSASKRAKTNGTGKHANGNGKPKLTAEKISEAQYADLLRHHAAKIVSLKETNKNASKALTKGYKLAAGDGIAKKDVDLAIAMKTDAGQQSAKTDVARIARVARCQRVDLDIQFEMFGVKSDADSIFEDGRRAAHNSEKATPPAHHGQKAQQRWLEGWHEGYAALNASRLKDIKPLGGGDMQPIGDAAAEVAAKAASIGTAPASHAQAH